MIIQDDRQRTTLVFSDEQENFLIICIYTTYTSKRLRFVGTNVKPAAFPPLLPTPLFTTVNCEAEELLFKVPIMLTGFVCDFELMFALVKAMDIVLAELASVILMPTPPTSSSLLLLLFAGLLMTFVLDILQETLFRLLTTDVKVITSLDGSDLIGAVAINCNFFEANTVSVRQELIAVVPTTTSEELLSITTLGARVKGVSHNGDNDDNLLIPDKGSEDDP
uniref:Uncharacterized protein n=1 Tax=Glossina pallidipes TaxID=7398 RepID=A0A1B0AG86_GLOPL